MSHRQATFHILLAAFGMLMAASFIALTWKFDFYKPIVFSAEIESLVGTQNIGIRILIPGKEETVWGPSVSFQEARPVIYNAQLAWREPSSEAVLLFRSGDANAVVKIANLQLNGKSIPVEELKTVDSTITTNADGSFILRSTGKYPQFNLAPLAVQRAWGRTLVSTFFLFGISFFIIHAFLTMLSALFQQRKRIIDLPRRFICKYRMRIPIAVLVLGTLGAGLMTCYLFRNSYSGKYYRFSVELCSPGGPQQIEFKYRKNLAGETIVIKPRPKNGKYLVDHEFTLFEYTIPEERIHSILFSSKRKKADFYLRNVQFDRFRQPRLMDSTEQKLVYINNYYSSNGQSEIEFTDIREAKTLVFSWSRFILFFLLGAGTGFELFWHLLPRVRNAKRGQ